MRITLLLSATVLASAILTGVGSAAIAQSTVSSPPPAATPQATPQPPADRARANHDAILRGEKTLFDLSPAEQDDVRALDRGIRAQPPPDSRDPYERCLDGEYARLGREPTALDQRTIETRCR